MRMAGNQADDLLSLLLLPPPPSSRTLESLHVSYGPTFTSTLKSVVSAVKKDDNRRIAHLDVAIAEPGLLSEQNRPRAAVFANCQSLLAGIYSLLSVLSAKEGVQLDCPGGVDVRVFLLDYTPGQILDTREQVRKEALQGPIIDLQTLVSSRRPWTRLFVPESEDGEVLLKGYSHLLNSRIGASFSRPDICRVSDGTRVVNTHHVDQDGSHNSQSSKPHLSVAVGGTFDHLHVGHKLLLTVTALLVEPFQALNSNSGQDERSVIIGITGDELLTKKRYAEYMESWDDRQRGVQDFMQAIIDFSPNTNSEWNTKSPHHNINNLQHISTPVPNGKYTRHHLPPNLKIDYVQISDPFGPTITDASISALVISKETRSGGKAVNDEREKKGWSSLEIFEVDVLDSGGHAVDGQEGGVAVQEFEAKISSTEIRRRQSELAKGNL